MKFLVPTLAASLLLAACGSSSSKQSSNSASSGGAVKTASNATLGATVLVDSHGMTLYHLSAEHNGKWICTKACLKTWHPLAAKGGGTPSGGVGSLGTIKRPEGTTQVTYKGMPLYTFAQDMNAGDASGQGIKDVGTWTAATTGSAASTPTKSTPAPAYGGGGGY